MQLPRFNTFNDYVNFQSVACVKPSFFLTFKGSINGQYVVSEDSGCADISVQVPGPYKVNYGTLF